MFEELRRTDHREASYIGVRGRKMSQSPLLTSWSRFFTIAESLIIWCVLTTLLTIDRVLGLDLTAGVESDNTLLTKDKLNLLKHFSLYNRMGSLWTISTPISPEILFRIEMCLVSSQLSILGVFDIFGGKSLDLIKTFRIRFLGWQQIGLEVNKSH